MEKVGRNDPCPCGSGKKFKKCCEEKVRHKKFDAQLIQKDQGKLGDTDKAAKISTGFFQRMVPPKPPAPPKDHPDTTDTPL